MDTAQLIDSLNREHWSPRLQRVYFTENSAVFLAGTDAADTLSSDGRKFHKPILSVVQDEAYTPGVDINLSDIEAEDQELVVDEKRSASAYIDDVSIRQNYYSAVSRVASDITSRHNNRIEQHFLSKISEAENELDIGILDPTNSIDVVNDGHSRLDSNDVPNMNRVIVIGPKTAGVYRKTSYQRETMLGDQVYANGVVMSKLGIPFVINNNLPWTATLDLSTAPTAGDTVTVEGVTFTFVTSVGTAPGNVVIGDAATSRANFKAALENGAGAGTTYVPVSRKDRFTLSKRAVTVTTDAQAVFNGFGDISVDETLTDGNGFTKQEQSLWFGMRGATDLVVQLPGSVEFTRKERGHGTIAKGLALYGAKTFEDGAIALVNMKHDTSWF